MTAPLSVLQTEETSEYASRSDPVIKEHIEKGKKSQKYTSKTIQNEVINVIGLCLREKVLEPLKLQISM